MINLEVIFSWQLIMLGVFISGLTHLVKVIVKTENHYWQEVVLPIVPFVLGMGLGCIHTVDLYPDTVSSLAARVIFGGVSGLLSAALYRSVNALLSGGAGNA